MEKSGRRITRRGIQIALGLLWFLDGALQLQHQMFTSNFTSDVIAPAAQGQPILVSGVMHFGIRVFLTHPAIFNALIAITQLGLGLLILWKRTAKYGLIFSVFWGLFVWYVGEGLGGLASGHTLLLMGAPGAALLYSILALGVMPTIASKEQARKQPAYWLVIVWSIMWVIGAIYQLLPGQNTIADLSSMISSMASGAPSWLASIDTHTSSVIHGIGGTSQISGMHMSASQMASMPAYQDSGFWFIVLLAIIQILIGLMALSPYMRKLAVGAGIILSLAFWIIGQSLGGYYTGLATDPSTAPLFILLGIAILGCSQLSFKRLLLSAKRSMEKLLT